MDLRQINTNNYYQLLGIDQKASTSEIRSKYRELARVYHPDSNYYSDISTDKVSADQIEFFKLLTSAYHTLIDPKKREEYDLVFSPVVSERIGLWDVKTDDLLEKPRLSSTASFGNVERPKPLAVDHAAARKRKSTSEMVEQARTKYFETQMKENLKKEKAKKRKIMIFIALGLIIASTSTWIFFTKFNNTSTPAAATFAGTTAGATTGQSASGQASKK